MAEIAVAFALDQLIPLLTKEISLIKGIHKKFKDIKDELESIQAFLKDADNRAAAEGHNNTSEGVKIWVKQVREAACRIENIIDDYLIHMGQQPRNLGRVALFYKIAHLLKTMIPRHRIASEIQDIKSSMLEIKERSERYGFQRSFEQGSNISIRSRNTKWHDPRLAALYNDDIEFAVIDNKNESRIFITTRNLEVVVSCKKSSFIEVLELQPLTQEQSFELFNKKVFRFDYSGCCPKELIDITYDIVKKCKGLPLAIVAIGGLLSTREKNVFEWQRFSKNLSLELRKDTHLIGIKEILALSYDDLPYYLKSCLLYFGIYPEDYEVKLKRVIRQWIAEGFVKEERGKTLEEVGEGYLTELIHRSLVQVSLVKIDGKTKGCRVHDLIRDMMLEKFEDLNFCTHINEDGKPSLSGIIRRLSIETSSHDLIAQIESSHVRSLLVFTNKESVIYFMSRILTKYRLLKVLDYESTSLVNVPEKLGNLIHLKYLGFRHARIDKLPKSIGMLQNLETLDVRDTNIHELPEEISKIKNLRHLLGYAMSLIPLKNGIGEMTSLQTLRYVDLGMDGAAEVIKELGKLKHIRELGLINVWRKDESILSTSINEMQDLEKLHVASNFTFSNEPVDLNLISLPTMLRKLSLCGRLQRVPEWIPDLQNLVVLRLVYSGLTIDPMQSLKSLQNLLILSIDDSAYEGLCLNFENGWFQKLKELCVGSSDELRDIIIDKGALPSLKKLQLCKIRKLENIPTGLQHLEKLEVFNIWNMEVAFVQSISIDDWNWIMEHVPIVEITTIDGNVIPNSRR